MLRPRVGRQPLGTTLSSIGLRVPCNSGRAPADRSCCRFYSFSRPIVLSLPLLSGSLAACCAIGISAARRSTVVCVRIEGFV